MEQMRPDVAPKRPLMTIRRANMPDGARVGLVTMLRFLNDPLGALQRAERLYGYPFTSYTFMGPVVQLSDPEDLRAVFTADADSYEVLGPEVIAPFLGQHSVLLHSGARHRTERKLLMPPLHGARMRHYGAIIRDAALRHGAAWTPGRRFSFEETAQAISLEVIARAIFGFSDPRQAEEVCGACRDYINAFHPLNIFMPWTRLRAFGVGPWARFLRRAEALSALLLAQIRARRAAAPGDDILSLLLSARYDDGSAMSDDEVRDQLTTLLFAGHETTAISLAWAVYQLLRSPAAAARLRAELVALPQADGGPEVDALAAAPYLDAVCQETLRRNPVIINVTRKLRRPLAVKGYTLPAGVSVSADILVTHNRPDLYPEPDRWRPERFLERSYTPFEFLPFGGGHRRCLGAAFATYEMKIVLGTLLSRYRLRLAEERPLRTVRRNFTMGPQDGVPVVLEP